MKELDKSKKYDLSKLNDEQLIELLKEVNKESKLFWVEEFKDTYLFFGKRSKTWLISDVKNKDIKCCATELFEYEYRYRKQEAERQMMLNKINSKTMTEEEKELWLFVYKESVKYQQSFLSHKEKADQAVKDFREALKM